MRRFFLATAWSLLPLAAAVLTSPWWLGWVAPTMVGWAGGRVRAYETVGYGRFAVTDLRLRVGAVDVAVDRLEAPTPWLWVVGRAFGVERSITVGAWQVSTAPTAPKTTTPAAGPGGWLPTRALLLETVERANAWVARGEVGPGRIDVGPTPIDLGALTWGDRRLRATQVRVAGQTLDLEFTLGGAEIALVLATVDGRGRVELRSRGDRVDGAVTVLGQLATVRATYGQDGWLPHEAEMTAEAWALPGDALRVGDRYGRLTGGGHLVWRDGAFNLRAEATGFPVAAGAGPGATAHVVVVGDVKGITVQSLDLTTDGFTADLSAPVRLDWQGRWQSDRARFRWGGDLAKVAGAGLTGNAAGVAEMAPGPDAWPVITWDATLDNVRSGEWSVVKAAARGSLHWPELTVTTLALEPLAGERVEVSGKANLATRRLDDVRFSAAFGPKAWARFLPGGVTFRALSAKGTARGAFAKPDVNAEVTVSDLVTPWTQPGELRVEGGLERIQGILTTAEATVTAVVAPTDGGWQVSELSWVEGDRTRLRLEAPFRIWKNDGWVIETGRLVGDEAGLGWSLALGRNGHSTLTARQLDVAWVTKVFRLPLEAGRVRRLDVDGTWADGPWLGRVVAEVEYPAAASGIVEGQVAARLTEAGIEAVALVVTAGGGEGVTVRGRAPVVVYPTRVGADRVQVEGPIGLQVALVAASPLWAKLSEVSGLVVERPQLTAAVTGTWAAPELVVKGAVAKVAWGDRWPAWAGLVLTETALDVRATGAGLESITLTGRVNGQSVAVAAEVPIALAEWTEASTRWREWCRRASGTVSIQQASLATLAGTAQTWLVPRGTLSAEVRMEKGAQFFGKVRIDDAAFRPLGSLGSMQDVDGELTLDGRVVRVAELGASLGGQRLTLSGDVDLTDPEQWRGDLRLAGTNVPLVRQAGLLVRADVALRLQKEREAEAVLSGRVTLRDSLLASDVRALIPRGGGAGGTRRAPYFSVDAPFFAPWGLAVDVVGTRFLRIRTALFTGQLSAQYRLSGTLGDPRLTGESLIDDGRILLPFASFAVERGVVRLTEANPATPEIALSATSRRYGYDLDLDVTGPVDRPVVTFGSSPALTSEQVLLMVTAGELPRDDLRYSGGQRLARLGAFVGQSLLGSVSDSEGAMNRVEITSGERVSRQGRETYRIELGLTPSWSLEGEYDEYDDYNAGVRWRFLGAPKAKEAPDAKP